MTRLEPGATVIIIATRWHSDDLIGRILKHFPEKWENICLPAFAGKNDPIGRAEGEVLFPERYDVKEIEDQRELLGSVFFHALYQQGPVDEILQFTNKEWINVCQELPADDFKWARVWDLAATESGGDYTCGTLCGFSKSTKKFVIGNVLRKQVSIGDVETLVRDTAVLDGIDTAVCIEQEPGSSGKSLVHHYETTVLPEFKVIPVPTAGKAKLIRAQPFLAAAEAGKVYLLDQSVVNYDKILNSENVGGDGTWHQTFLKEFDSFPGGDNDDQIDTAAAGYTFLSGKKTLSVSWGRRNKESEDRLDNRKARQARFMIKSPKRKLIATFGRK
jgi:phage terminase large subunit-like protein